MNITDIIGFCAMIGSMLSLLPQVVKIYKTRSAKDVSMLSAFNFLIAGVLWFIYGIMTDAWSVWLTNIFMSTFALMLIGLKFSLDKKQIIETNRK